MMPSADRWLHQVSSLSESVPKKKSRQPRLAQKSLGTGSTCWNKGACGHPWNLDKVEASLVKAILHRLVTASKRSTDLALGAIESYSRRCEVGIYILVPWRRMRYQLEAWDIIIGCETDQQKLDCPLDINSLRKLDVGSTY